MKFCKQKSKEKMEKNIYIQWSSFVVFFFQFFLFTKFHKKITDPENVLKSSTGIEYMSNTICVANKGTVWLLKGKT